MAASVNNYYIGKGIVSFWKTGDMSGYRDVGNVPVFEFEPTIEELDHFSSRSGVKELDRSIVISKTANVKMTMEEWTLDNLAMAMLGTPVNAWTMDVFAANAVEGKLKFIGSNEVGRAFSLVLNSVSFLPGSALSFISEEWGKIEVTGKAATVNGSFGYLEDLDLASSGSG